MAHCHLNRGELNKLKIGAKKASKFSWEVRIRSSGLIYNFSDCTLWQIEEFGSSSIEKVVAPDLVDDLCTAILRRERRVQIIAF